MSAPWFKFYPANWRGDPALRMCSIAARGLWMEMLCIMHEAEPRGRLLVNGVVVTERQLASLAGIAPKTTSELLLELEKAGVFSRDESGCIFSRRMMRETAKALRDKENGGRGGNPGLLRGLTPPLSPDPTPRSQKPEDRSQKEIKAAAPPYDSSGDGGAAALLEVRLREAAGLVGDNAPSLRNVQPISALMAEGFGLEGAILPALRAVAAAGRKGRSWAYYVGPIRERMKAVAVPPASAVSSVSQVFVRRGTPQWEAWERYLGHELKSPFSPQGEPGRYFETPWPPGCHPATNSEAA